MKNKIRVSGVLFIILLAVAGYILTRPQYYYPAPKQDESILFYKKDIGYPFTFIVYGDSREPAGYEKKAIIERIIKERPDFVIHLGDIVEHGTADQWEMFDEMEGKTIQSGIPFYPVLGNHEYYTEKEKHPAGIEAQLKLYFDRFKFLKNRRWYSFKYGNSLFLILDTKTDYTPGSRQYKWLLANLKNERPIFLFIAFHYPPYTKNAGRPPYKTEKLLANIFESYSKRNIAKTDIVFTSHTHNYERYLYNGINYVVSGGGGAPQHGINRDPDDFYKDAGKTFHYCKVKVSEKELLFEMIKLDKNTNTWIISDTFKISK